MRLFTLFAQIWTNYSFATNVNSRIFRLVREAAERGKNGELSE